LAERPTKLKGATKGSKEEKKYRRACRRLGNEKRRQRRLLLLEIADRFNKEHPAIDSEWQLSCREGGQRGYARSLEAIRTDDVETDPP
jgi:hypothetical protein